jgi:hypothetical protein
MTHASVETEPRPAGGWFDVAIMLLGSDGPLLDAVSKQRRENHDWTVFCEVWPPLWSSGHSTWLQIQRSRVRFPTLPDFLSSNGSGTGSTQPREDK